MSIPFTTTSLVKDIVNEAPKTSDVFKKHRIDFCCGGNIPLATAAQEKSVNIDELLQELTTVYENSDLNEDVTVWTNSSSEEIIQHIIEHYHRPLDEELHSLSPYVTKVSLEVFVLFSELKQDLLEHTAKEEATSFPLLLTLDNPNTENKEEIVETIRGLEKEHDHAGDILKKLREITDDFTPPADGCGTYRLVYKRLEMAIPSCMFT